MKPHWIKIRDDIDTHPKVLHIARLISTTASAYFFRHLPIDLLGDASVTLSSDASRDVTVASLRRQWRDVARHARVTGVTQDPESECHPAMTGDLQTVDCITGVPGFGKAMEKVGWIIVDKERNLIFFPNFLEFNKLGHEKGGQPKSSGAERQARYLAKKRQLRDGAAPSEMTRHSSVTIPVTTASPATSFSTKEEEEEETSSTTTTTTPAGARIGREEAKAWAIKANAGDVSGIPITPEIVDAWFDDRQSAGWQERRNGHEYDIRDWQANLRKFARHWRNNAQANLKFPKHQAGPPIKISTPPQGNW